MSSSSRYSVVITGQVKKLLELLAREDPLRCRQLALVLLSLEMNPEPDGSRELCPGGKPAPGERVWEYGAFWLAYRVDREQKVVDVGSVKQGRSS